MMQIGPNTRLRVSPFFDATIEAGATAFSPYNKMLMPVSFGDPSAEYERLINAVSQWDVSVQRQIEISGPDAARLAQILSVRDLSKCAIGQGKYVPMCDHAGNLINDPVVLKLAEDKFWFSIADNNIELGAQSIAHERQLNVEICEPDVSPLAVQGPKAEDVVAKLFGEWVRDLKFFWFADVLAGDIPVKLVRAGFSKQGGFELFLMDGSRGKELWNLVHEAGISLGIGPGYPNPVERIESGLLSYGGDTDAKTNPFEVRLEKYVNLTLDDEVIGIRSLRKIKEEGVKRHQLGVKILGQEAHEGHAIWYDIEKDGVKVGNMTNGGWSPRLNASIGFALVSVSWQPGDIVTVMKHGQSLEGTLCELPFI